MEITLYHGSPIKIKDIGMKSGTYFTDDLEVAKQYGNIVYEFKADEKTIRLFYKDCFDEHFISSRLIPFYLFEIKVFEIWKDVVGYEGIYQVSNIGNVKSLNYNNMKKEQLLSPFLCNGYLRVILSKNNMSIKFNIHRLLAIAFIPNPKNKPQVNHIDGIKTNNFDYNLEWNTQSENIKHAHKLGLINQNGVRNHQSKLTEIQVLEIRKSDLSLNKLAEKYNVCFQLISSIKLRKVWKHI